MDIPKVDVFYWSKQKDAGQQFHRLPNVSNSVIVADAACRRPRLHST
jgi:hypothetical protein